MPTGGDRPIEGTIALTRVDAGRLSAEVPGSLGPLRPRSTARPASGSGPPSDPTGPPPGGQCPPDRGRPGGRGGADPVGPGLPGRPRRRPPVRRPGRGAGRRVPGQRRRPARRRPGSRRDRGRGPAPPASGSASLWDLLGTERGARPAPGAGLAGGAGPDRTWGRPTSGPAASSGLKDLIWGERYHPRGTSWPTSRSAPGSWRLGPFEGDLWGSPLRGGILEGGGRGRRARSTGSTSGSTGSPWPRLFAFDPGPGPAIRGDRPVPGLGPVRRGVPGPGRVPWSNRGKVTGLPVAEARVAAEWDVRIRGRRPGDDPGPKQADGPGRRAARSGAMPRSASGPGRDFHAGLTIDGLDLRVISQAASHERRPIPGRISGTIAIRGDDVAGPSVYRGKIDLDLDNASILDVPMLESLNHQLGVARGRDLRRRRPPRDDRPPEAPGRPVHPGRPAGPAPRQRARSASTRRVNLKVLININQSHLPDARPLAGQQPQRGRRRPSPRAGGRPGGRLPRRPPGQAPRLGDDPPPGRERRPVDHGRGGRGHLLRPGRYASRSGLSEASGSAGGPAQERSRNQASVGWGGPGSLADLRPIRGFS